MCGDNMGLLFVSLTIFLGVISLAGFLILYGAYRLYKRKKSINYGIVILVVIGSLMAIMSLAAIVYWFYITVTYIRGFGA